MKYAIIADIHANLEALNVVLEDIKAQGCTHTACLGDVVGYGANPKECLDIIRGMNIPCVKGNHDEMCSVNADLEGFNPHAAEAVHWTRQQLDEDDCQWLRDLKYIRLVTSFSIVHATLDVPQKWGYVFDKLAAAASFTYQNTPVCFFGHTHVPRAYIRDHQVHSVDNWDMIAIEPGKKYFLNVGSVGQPRDGDWRASYAIYSPKEHHVQLRRLDYDVEQAQQKIIAAGLPPRLATRLGEGR